jgi:intracellular septation protein A
MMTMVMSDPGTEAKPTGGPSALAPLKRLAVDVLAGWVYLAIFLATGNIYLSVAVALAAGLCQLIWAIARRQKTDPMQWMALGLVVVLGGATLVTHNPTFVVFKPSIFEAALATMMLRPGWMIRYSPGRIGELIPRLSVAWGYVWAVSFFALAATNPYVASAYGLKAWAVWTNFSPLILVAVLWALSLLIFPPIVRRAARARGIDIKSILSGR